MRKSLAQTLFGAGCVLGLAACQGDAYWRWKPPPLAAGEYRALEESARQPSTEPRPFAIAAQRLDLALNAFQAQSGVRVVATSGDLARLTSAEVSGVFRPGEAMTRLLAGTGLGLFLDDGGRMIVGVINPLPIPIAGR